MLNQARSVDGGTRKRVMALLLKSGPVTASTLGEQTGISAAGIRRHLDKLTEAGLIETCEPLPVAGEEPPRGRPAKHYCLTEEGRESFGSNYENMALDAIEALEELGGHEAVKAFAKTRIERILEEVEPISERSSSGDLESVVLEVVSVLERHGYVASVTQAGTGIQICQHHCPVSQVASAHPEICEAEQEMIAKIVGRHIQPLASIREGNGVCTTNIPLAAVHGPKNNVSERSGK